MKIEVTRAFYLHGQPHAVGSVVDVDAALAAELQSLGKAKPALLTPPAADEKPAPRRTRKESAE
jgi:hypothetical protein